MWAGVGNTQVTKSGLTFWFSNPETSLPVARVPDVLSKAPSLGRPWDTGCPSKSACPPPFGAAHGGSGSLASGSYTILASALRPHLPPWRSPSFWDPAPTSLEAAEKARVWDRTPLGAGPNPTMHVPQKQCFLQGKNQAKATARRTQTSARRAVHASLTDASPGTCRIGLWLCSWLSITLSSLVLVSSRQRLLGSLGCGEQATEGILVLNLKTNILGPEQGIPGSLSGLWILAGRCGSTPVLRPGLVGISPRWKSELCPRSQKPNLLPSLCGERQNSVLNGGPKKEMPTSQNLGVGFLFRKKGLGREELRILRRDELGLSRRPLARRKEPCKEEKAK